MTFANGQAASWVFGQQDFVTNAVATASASSLHLPSGVALDASGNVWVVDHLNYRVLQFKAPFTNGESASLVLGQPDLTSNAQNNGGRTANSLGGPNGIAIDASGNLWVADGGANGRVLKYTPPFSNFMAASLVLGAPDFTSVSPGVSQTSVSQPGGGGPEGLAFDSSGNVWVADDQANRVLRFNAPFTNGQPASVVLGQPDFISSSAATPPTASSLNQPLSVTVDSSGNVWVTDAGNNRVLKYSPPFTNGQAASAVIGQPLFSSNSAPNPPTATSLRQPTGVTVDSSGHLWIVDTLNNRLLQYDPPFANGQAAAVVLGQPDFVSNAAPAPPTASSLHFPFGPVAFRDQQLWVADDSNNRVLAYVAVPPPSTVLYSVKFLCGRQSAVEGNPPSEPPVKPGNYATAINIHNFHKTKVILEMKAVIALPHSSQPLPPSQLVKVALGPNQALELDCSDIVRLFRGMRLPPFIKGFVEIIVQEPPVELSVVGVYTAQGAQGGSVSLEVVQYRQPFSLP